MRHVVINPTWRCQLACAYCWLPHARIDRQAHEVPVMRWVLALERYLTPGDLVDVSGGEPLLRPGLDVLLHRLGNGGIRWALTTNALATEAIDRMLELLPHNSVQINASDHAGNAAAWVNVRRLRAAGYNVQVNRVAHEAAGNHEAGGVALPYQDWQGGQALDGLARSCDAGDRHWVADPAGNVWRCQVWLQLGKPSMGNLFDGSFMPSVGAWDCTTGCSSCYRDTPEAWEIGMSVCER